MYKIKGTKLTFIKEVESKISKSGRKQRMGLFRCICGKDMIKRLVMRNGKYVKSCKKCKDNSHAHVHGLINHTLYRKWQDMKKRCYNPNVDRYNAYGAIGIKVCNEWKNDFMSFYNWSINNGWEEGLTIDRIDVEKDYTPSNCRYITQREQMFNKKNTVYVQIKKDLKVSLKELLHRNKKDELYRTIWSGIKNGKTIEYYIQKHRLKLDYVFISAK